ncbi:unnamed protein product [Schistosoma margrebowiei]|uniref:Uncharacterized protein n=1 Tax=Schistosoma margrebowiei TaxID=48269 RepID=A0AA85AA51_9TREM|nr:unnamed protein product [Schistosoma margrebowiei]
MDDECLVTHVIFLAVTQRSQNQKTILSIPNKIYSTMNIMTTTTYANKTDDIIDTTTTTTTTTADDGDNETATRNPVQSMFVCLLFFFRLLCFYRE